MKRSTALILFIFVDIFAVLMTYFLIIQPLREIFGEIANNAPSIEYSTTFFLVFGCAVIPVVHIIGLIENYLPHYFNRAICTKVIYFTIIASMLSGLATAAIVKKAIMHSGYTHCKGADTHMKLAHFKVYVLETETCRRLTEEKKSRNRAALR